MAVCVVTGTLVKLDGSAAAGQQIVATILSTADDQGGQVVAGGGVVSDVLEAYTDENGVWSIDLLQEASVLLEIPTINLRKEIVVPAVETVDFVSLI